MKLRKIFAEISETEVQEGLKANDVLAGAEWEFEFRDNVYRRMVEQGGSPKDEQVLEKAAGASINFEPWRENKAGAPYDKWVLKRDMTLNKFTGAELTNPPISLQDFLKICPRIFNAISKVGKTTRDCGLHINLSIKHPETINAVKLLLLVDEDRVYRVFNKEARKGSGGPVKEFLHDIIEEHIKIGPKELKEGRLTKPLEEALDQTLRQYLVKQYGINTGKLKYGYIEFRYMGGQNYHLKWDKIKNLIGMYVFILKAAADKNYKREEYQQKLSDMINRELIDHHYLINHTKRWLGELKPLLQTFHVKLTRVERSLHNIYLYTKPEDNALIDFAEHTHSSLLHYDKEKKALVIETNRALSVRDIPFQNYPQIKVKAEKLMARVSKQLNEMKLPPFIDYAISPRNNEVILFFPPHTLSETQFEQLGSMKIRIGGVKDYAYFKI